MTHTLSPEILEMRYLHHNPAAWRLVFDIDFCKILSLTLPSVRGVCRVWSSLPGKTTWFLWELRGLYILIQIIWLRQRWLALPTNLPTTNLQLPTCQLPTCQLPTCQLPTCQLSCQLLVITITWHYADINNFQFYKFKILKPFPYLPIPKYVFLITEHVKTTTVDTDPSSRWAAYLWIISLFILLSCDRNGTIQSPHPSILLPAFSYKSPFHLPILITYFSHKAMTRHCWIIHQSHDSSKFNDFHGIFSLKLLAGRVRHRTMKYS